MADKTQATPVVKRSVLAQVVEDGLLTNLVSGAIWEKDAADIKADVETLVKFRKVVSAAFKMFDQELTNRRNIQGENWLEGVDHFRKPRTSSGGNSLLDDLSI
jgi:hypothetical protein